MKHTEYFVCYAILTEEKNKHRNSTPATTAIGHCRTGALNMARKKKICKKHQTLKV